MGHRTMMTAWWRWFRRPPPKVWGPSLYRSLFLALSPRGGGRGSNEHRTLFSFDRSTVDGGGVRREHRPGGCAATPKQAAKDATEGALEEIKEQNQTSSGSPPMQDLASNIVKGAAAELDRPETRAQLGRIVETTMRSAVGSAVGELGSPQWGRRQWEDSPRGFHVGPTPPAADSLAQFGPLGALGGKMAEGFTLGMSRQLQIELGSNGQGPLGQTMAGVMREATQAAISGVTQELAPTDCVGLDSRQCADRRVRDLSNSAAKGFVEGLGTALQLPLLAVAFGAGVVGALVLVLLLRLRRPCSLRPMQADPFAPPSSSFTPWFRAGLNRGDPEDRWSVATLWMAAAMIVPWVAFAVPVPRIHRGAM